MAKYQQLDPHSETLHTAMGAVFVGDKAIFRGKNLHQDLAQLEWMELYLFGITGRRFNAKQVRLLNAIWSYTSYTDSRLWNNRVAALAGTTRSTGNLAMASALAVSEAKIYGRGINMRAMEFLYRAEKHILSGGALNNLVNSEIKKRRSLAGYGRPIAMADERIAPLLELARQLELAHGKYLELAYKIETALLEGRWRATMNYAGVAAALCADMGFSAQEYYMYVTLLTYAGMPPCYLEARQKPAGYIFPTRVDQIQYEGVAPRQWKS